MQETYVRVCQYSEGTEVRQPRALMYSVARSIALDHVKRAGFRLDAGIDGTEAADRLSGFSDPDPALMDLSSREEFALFCDAVRMLPVQCRRVFVLKKVYGYSQREIADLLGITENTVEKHVGQGMRLCLKFLSVQPGWRRR